MVGDRGSVTYRIKSDWDDTGAAGTLRADQLLAADAEAAAALWQFCFDVDLVTIAQAGMRPIDDPLPLQLLEPVRAKRTIDEPFYLRLLDVGAALSARTYATDATLVVAVVDQFCPDNAGTWLRESRGGTGQRQRTGQPADLRLDVADLSSAYLGGVRSGSSSAPGVSPRSPPVRRRAPTRCSPSTRSRGTRGTSDRACARTCR